MRALAGFGNDRPGAKLLNAAFGEGGPLHDPAMEAGEANDTHELFAGAYGVLRNPAVHREVDYDNFAEASEAMEDAAQIVHDVVQGREHGPRRDMALLSSAAALVVSDLAVVLVDGLELAVGVDDGRAGKTLELLAATTNGRSAPSGRSHHRATSSTYVTTRVASLLKGATTRARPDPREQPITDG